MAGLPKARSAALPNYSYGAMTWTKYYFAGTSRIASRACAGMTCSDPVYYLTDHLGSTSITTDSGGAKIAEMRYTACPLRFTAGVLRKGEVRYNWGSTPTDYTYTGQYSNVPDFGLMFYNARWYDPGISEFTSPDTLIPDLYNPLDWNRYSYARGNPLKYTDPSGHRVCGLGGSGVCEKDEELIEYAYQTVKDYGTNDLEAVARIVDKAARIYRTYDKMIPALSMVFLGLEESSPVTILGAAYVADPCAAVGRSDCGANSADEVFGDSGFHKNFQDGKSQPFHYWTYVATTASTDYPLPAFNVAGIDLAQLGNFAHEILGIGDPAGASWQDYALAEAGIRTGIAIASRVVPPNQLGNYIRQNIGTQSSGVPYVDFMINFWPLQGNLR